MVVPTRRWLLLLLIGRHIFHFSTQLIFFFDFAFDSKMSSEAIVWNGQLKGHLHNLCRNRNLRPLLWSGLLNMQGHLQRTSTPHERRGAARHGGPAYTSHCHGRPYSFRSVSGMSRQHREQHDYPSKRQRHSAELATASLLVSTPATVSHERPTVTEALIHFAPYRHESATP